MLEELLASDQRIAAVLFQRFGVFVVFLQQVLGHRRHDGGRQQIGGKHGKDDGLGQRDKEILRHAAEKEHWYEDDTNGKRRDKGGDRDLGRAIENGLLDLLALLEIAVDVLDLNGCIVDQDADGQRQTAKSHDVD